MRLVILFGDFYFLLLVEEASDRESCRVQEVKRMKSHLQNPQQSCFGEILATCRSLTSVLQDGMIYL